MLSSEMNFKSNTELQCEIRVLNKMWALERLVLCLKKANFLIALVRYENLVISDFATLNWSLTALSVH